MFDKQLFRINKIDYYIDIDFDLLKDTHIQILKYLVNNLDIEFEIIENHLICYYFIIKFKSKILKDKIKVFYNFNNYKHFNEEYNFDSVILTINSLLRDIDFVILNKKKFGIIPITELPHKYYHKILSKNV
jgi:hypothetical protein